MAATAPTFAPASDQAFSVHFSNPSPLLRFAQRPVEHWKFFGAGELVFKAGSIVLRGRRPRPLGYTEQSAEIPLADIFNVAHMGKVVLLHVRIPLAAEKPLQLWASDEPSARQIAQFLPQERTADFDRLVSDREAFNQALEGVETRGTVTPVLVVLNCLGFALALCAGSGVLTPNSEVLIRLGSNFGPFTLEGQWWRLLSSSFLNFGLVHLLVNMWALWETGGITERLFGSARFLLLYVFAGLCGSVASLLWNPDGNTAGASGAIFGVLGGLLACVFRPETPVPAEILLRVRISAGVFVLYNLACGFILPGIDNSAHIGGLLGGLAMGWSLVRTLDIDGRAHPALQLSLAALGGTAALCVLSWPLGHPDPNKAAEWHFREELELFTWDEQRAQAEQRVLDQLQTHEKITRVQWGERVASDLLPRWEAAEGRLASVHLPRESAFAQLPQQLVAYVDERRLGLTLLSEAARNNDPAKLKLGESVLAKNDTREKELARRLPAAH